MMKYFPGDEAPVVLVEQDDYFGYVSLMGEHVYYSQWVNDPNDWTNSRYDVYSCALEGCVPEKVGELPKGSNWNFLVTGSGAILTASWVEWNWEAEESVYDVSATSSLGNGTTSVLFTS